MKLPWTLVPLAALLSSPAALRASSISVTHCVPADLGLCFVTINDQTDNNPPVTATPETFTQILGVNNGGTIVGYYGSGTLPDHPNKGILLNAGVGLPATLTINSENVPGSAQTQVVGINNLAHPTTVGFWVNSTGANFGFADIGGVFTTVADPATTGAVNQLLGVNNSNVAAGFYTDAAGNNHAYLYNIGTATFSPIILPSSFNAVSTTAAGVNNAGVVVGFYTDGAGNTHGFIEANGVYSSYNDPSGANLMFLGLNNVGQVVGSYVNSAGVTNGLLADFNSTYTSTNGWFTIDDPFASSMSAFGVNGTTINGINDNGDMVGFFSNGHGGVEGFYAAPEPASLMLAAAGALVLLFFCRRPRRTF